MPETILITDFSAGWIPNDDMAGGRKNGLHKMDSLCQEFPGAITMAKGTANVNATNYPSEVHSLYVKAIAATNHRWLASNDGKVYRDASTTEIFTGGSNTYACFNSFGNFVFILSGDIRKKDSGAAVTDLGIVTPGAAPGVANAGAGVLTGDYEYAQQYVANFGGGYLAKSALSAIATITLTADNTTVTGRLPSTDDPQANELWIFRRGGGLEFWHRVKKLTASYDTPFTDNLTDDDALALGIGANISLAPANSTNIPSVVVAMVGPVAGRFIYVTESAIYFSETYSPDSIDTRTTISFAGSGSSGSEIGYWAVLIAKDTILIGTSTDIYVLYGTFKSLPDGSLDITFAKLNVDSAPIARTATLYKGAVIYMSSDGWRICDGTGTTVNLVKDSLEQLYYGNSLNDYGGVPIFPFPRVNGVSALVKYYSARVKDRLYVIIPQIVGGNAAAAFAYKMHVFDLIRKTWRPFPYTAPTAICADDIGIMEGVFNNGVGTINLRYIEVYSSYKLEGAVKQQVEFLTPFQHNGSPLNRKSPQDIFLRIDTGGDNLTLKVYINDLFSSPVTITTTLNSNGLSDIYLPVNNLLAQAKTYAFYIYGQAAYFRLLHMGLTYEAFPNPMRYEKTLRYDFGELNGRLKKIASWPLVLCSKAANVVVTVLQDGASLNTDAFNTAADRLVACVYQVLNQPTFGLDYQIQFQCDSEFEVLSIGPPEILEVLPIEKTIDQVGPAEIFRYGHLKMLEARFYSLNAFDLNMYVYIDEVLVLSDVIALEANKDIVYTKDLPRDTKGSIIKVLFTSANYSFYRQYTRILAATSGKDTDNRWVSLDPQQVI